MPTTSSSGTEELKTMLAVITNTLNLMSVQLTEHIKENRDFCKETEQRLRALENWQRQAQSEIKESSVDDSSVVWRELIKVLHLDQPFGERGIPCAEGPVSEFLVLDDQNLGSICSSIAWARDNARTVRERISTELWEAITYFE